tara:strand:+ start:16956 stop:19211 length:2256 start_codon:yes stop_codon:yes gene_type:complete
MKKGKNLKDTKIKHFNPMALREKYDSSYKKKSNPFSSFWADNSWETRRTSILDLDNDIDENGEIVKPKKPGVDHIKLASYRRAISNFVTIVTNKSDIPVRFQSNDDSYTDGKRVVIGSKIDEKNFDPVVGLALHEGSHIKLSDFEFLRNLENNIPEEFFLKGEKVGFGRYDVRTHIKNLLNYVEDRRIDNYVFTSSPGYKGYYHSMYDKYFHSKVIDKALLTDSHTSLDWDSYIMRILNLTNKNRRLDVLPDLDKIYKTIFGGGRVKKLNSTEEAFNVALEVYSLILNNLPEIEFDENGNPIDTSGMSGIEHDGDNGSPTDGESGGTTMSDDEFDSLLDSLETSDSMSGGSGGENSIQIPSSSDSNYSASGTDEKGKPIQLSDRQRKQLMNAIEKQKDFNNGDTKKVGKLTKKDSAIVKTMEEAGVEKVTAGEGIGSDEYDYRTGEYLPGKGVDVIYVKKLTQTMIDESLFPSVIRGQSHYYRTDESVVAKGVSLGTKLGRKLQVRGESRDLKWNRLDSGKIDKRLIAELGFGNERVFSTTFVDKYSDAFLHISVDASGSMGGDKWNQTMITTIALIKAIDMIQGLDVMVSFRSTHDTNRYGRGNSCSPLILVAYDSRVDKFSKVKKMFPNIYPGGTTPEGLCFEAIMKDILPTTNTRDSYFLNISDGMPMFSNSSINYYHQDAVNHTKRQVDEFRKMGVKVLSYFVSDSSYGREDSVKDFKRMYGKDAEMIDLSSVVQISKTMNDKFLEK